MDVQEYATVIKFVCTKLGVDVADNTLIRNVTQFCKKLNHKQLKQRYVSSEERHEAMAATYVDSITMDEGEFDYTNYLYKKENEKKNKNDIVQPLTQWMGDRMPIISSKAMSVYIDSRLRNVDQNNSKPSFTDFQFSLVPRSTRATIGDGRIQARIAPSHVTYFKVGKIILPYAEELRSRNFTNEITLTFTALRSNGIISREDTYHFTFTYTPLSSNPALVELTPTNEYCKFNPPLRIVDDISLRFNDPILPVAFPVDRMRPSSINYLSSDGRITFADKHNLVDNDIIVVMGLSTNNNAANSTMLGVINDPRGVKITKIDDYMIAMNIDLTKIVSHNVSSLPLILFYSRTFRMTLEIGYQDINGSALN